MSDTTTHKATSALTLRTANARNTPYITMKPTQTRSVSSSNNNTHEHELTFVEEEQRDIDLIVGLRLARDEIPFVIGRVCKNTSTHEHTHRAHTAADR